MPKLLVLVQSQRSDVVSLAEAAADGARRVRFAEVDVRRLPSADDVGQGSGARAPRPLARLDDIAPYDGLILVVDRGGEAGTALVQALGAFEGSLTNKVGCVLSPAENGDRRAVLWSVLSPMADRGMILVPATFGGHAPVDESARRAGTRVAEVVGWVTHARSHHHHEPHTHHVESHHH